MVVDSKSGDLLNELEEVDGAVEEGWLKFAFKINVVASGLVALDIVGDVDEGDYMDGELTKYRADDIGVEDVGLWALFGEAFNGLCDC